jgi:hypothetical protein
MKLASMKRKLINWIGVLVVSIIAYQVEWLRGVGYSPRWPRSLNDLHRGVSK